MPPVSPTSTNESLPVREPVPVPEVGYLDEDLSNIDTSRLVIRGKTLHEFEIVDVTEEENNDRSGSNLVIKTRTTSELPSTKGEMIPSGFPITRWISLVELPERMSDDGKKIRARTRSDILKDIAVFVEAVEGKKTTLKPLDRFKGLRVMGRISVQEPTEKYPNESNTITFVKRG